MRHQYGISALVSQTSFRGESVGGVAKYRLFPLHLGKSREETHEWHAKEVARATCFAHQKWRAYSVSGYVLTTS